MKLQRSAQQAECYPEMVCNNGCHLIDRDCVLEAYRQTQKGSAPGMDQVTAQQYAEHLDENLRDLYERLRAKRYGRRRSSGCGSRRKTGREGQ